MNMILTSECEECDYGLINEYNPAKIKVFCKNKNKEYYYGQCVPCENKTKKRYRSYGEFSDLVFVTSMGSPVFRHHAEKEVKKVVKAINEQEAFDSVREQRQPHYFEDLYPHAIRHTFCSRCFQLNMNPKVVQKLMGHQHYSTTIDIYTHVMQDDIDSEVCKLESAIVTTPEE